MVKVKWHFRSCCYTEYHHWYDNLQPHHTCIQQFLSCDIPFFFSSHTTVGQLCMIHYSKKHLYRSSENWICSLLFTAWIHLQHKCLFVASSFSLVTLLHLALYSEWSPFQSFPSIVIAFCQLKKFYYLTVNHEVIFFFFWKCWLTNYSFKH